MRVIFTVQSDRLLVKLQAVVFVILKPSAYRGGEVQFIDRGISNRIYESRHLLQTFIFLLIYMASLNYIYIYICTCFCLKTVLSADTLLVIFVGYIFKFSHFVHICNYCDLYNIRRIISESELFPHLIPHS